MLYDCPECKEATQIEEIMINCTVSSDVGFIKMEDGAIRMEYINEPTVADGEVTHYQCGECGHIICSTPEELYEITKGA